MHPKLLGTALPSDFAKGQNPRTHAALAKFSPDPGQLSPRPAVPYCSALRRHPGGHQVRRRGLSSSCCRGGPSARGGAARAPIGERRWGGGGMRTAGRPLAPRSYAKYVRGGGAAAAGRGEARRHGAAPAVPGGRRPLSAQAWPSRCAGRSPSCAAGGPRAGRRRAALTGTAGAAGRRVRARLPGTPGAASGDGALPRAERGAGSVPLGRGRGGARGAGPALLRENSIEASFLALRAPRRSAGLLAALRAASARAVYAVRLGAVPAGGGDCR